MTFSGSADYCGKAPDNLLANIVIDTFKAAFDRMAIGEVCYDAPRRCVRPIPGARRHAPFAPPPPARRVIRVFQAAREGAPRKIGFSHCSAPRENFPS